MPGSAWPPRRGTVSELGPSSFPSAQPAEQGPVVLRLFLGAALWTGGQQGAGGCGSRRAGCCAAPARPRAKESDTHVSPWSQRRQHTPRPGPWSNTSVLCQQQGGQRLYLQAIEEKHGPVPTCNPISAVPSPLGPACPPMVGMRVRALYELRWRARQEPPHRKPPQSLDNSALSRTAAASGDPSQRPPTDRQRLLLATPSPAAGATLCVPK